MAKDPLAAARRAQIRSIRVAEQTQRKQITMLEDQIHGLQKQIHQKRDRIKQIRGVLTNLRTKRIQLRGRM